MWGWPDRAYGFVLRYERYMILAVVLLAWVGVLSGPLYMGIQAVLRLLCGLTGFPFALVQYYFF